MDNGTLVGPVPELNASPDTQESSMRRADQKKKEKSQQTCLKRFLKIMLSHVGLLVICILYAIGGAYMFIDVESTYEDEVNVAKQAKYVAIQNSKKYIVNDMWYQNSLNHSVDNFTQVAIKNVKLFHDFVVKAASNYHYKGRKDITPYHPWTFPNALIFTVTTMGAIGYGHVSPKTFKGQVACIFYGLIGVPLLLVFLANVGDFLANSLRYIYSRGCCIACRFKRRSNEFMRKGKKQASIFTDEIGEEVYMPTSEVDVPITVSVCILFVYLMVGGAIFSLWEGWPFYSAAYFSFITLSTIGFGDYVPSFGAKDTDLIRAFKMIVTASYSVFGMALLSMCINLIQEQIVNKMKWLSKELGMGEDEEDDEDKHKFRRSGDEVTVTPPEKDGNQRSRVKNLEDKNPNKAKKTFDKIIKRPSSGKYQQFSNIEEE